MSQGFTRYRGMEISEKKHAFENSEDLSSLKTEADQISEKLDDIHRKGEKLTLEKETLERQKEKIADLDLPQNIKSRIIGHLNAEIVEIQSQYDTEVSEEEKHLFEQAQNLYCKLGVGEDTSKEAARELERVELAEANTDTNAAAKEASDAARQFEIERKIVADKWELQQEQAAMLRQRMMTRKLTKR